jgi:hypothetical protein
MSEESSVYAVDQSGFPLMATGYIDPQQCAMYAILTDKEKDNIRQIVAEEVSKVFPVPHKKPDVGIPECPDCGGWVLSEHDQLTPLETQYRKWWCVCPEKVAAWEKQCQQDLDRLLEAIHSDDNEIEAVLMELSKKEFDELVARVKVRRGQVT